MNELNPYEPPTALSGIPDGRPYHSAQRCPSCSAEVTFWMALKMTTPFYFTCGCCGSRCRVHTPFMALIFVVITLAAVVMVGAIVAAAFLIGPLVLLPAIPLLIVVWIALEWWTHQYITRHGRFVPVSTGKGHQSHNGREQQSSPVA